MTSVNTSSDSSEPATPASAVDRADLEWSEVDGKLGMPNKSRKRRYKITFAEAKRRQLERFSRDSYARYMKMDRTPGRLPPEMTELTKKFSKTKITSFTPLIEEEAAELSEDFADLLSESGELAQLVTKGVDADGNFREQLDKITDNLEAALRDHKHDIDFNLNTHGCGMPICLHVINFISSAIKRSPQP